MKIGSAAEQELVRACIENGDESKFDAILSAITSSGALAYTQNEAVKAADRAAAAIAALPESKYKLAMVQLCTFAVGRNH